MALYVNFELAQATVHGEPQKNVPREYSWHVGENDGLKRIRSGLERNMNNIIPLTLIVQADMDELRHIRKTFPGLLVPEKPVVKFVGETAAFILLNL